MSAEDKDSPNYIGMGMLKIPPIIWNAMDDRKAMIEQAKDKYGYARENLLIEADNVLVRAIDHYCKEQNKISDTHGTEDL